MKVALINANGEIRVIFNPNPDIGLPDPAISSPEERLRVELTEEMSAMEPADVMRRWIWYQDSWYDRGMPPSLFYEWNWNTFQWELGPEYTRRAKVDKRTKLRLSDWTQEEDAPLSPLQKKAWQMYRQQLRDLDVSQWDDLRNIEWPKEI